MAENEIPFMDEEDHEIVMHRDAHFSGNFDEMIRYYEGDGVGVQESILIERIKKIQEVERQNGGDIRNQILSDHEKKQVEDARTAYLQLREIYEKKEATDLEKAYVDLVLCEDEDPEEVIDQIASFDEASELLLQTIESEKYYNPLFPGYGHAPALAARALGKIGDSKAVIPLFEALGIGHPETEDAICSALAAIGKPSKEFILSQLQKRPLNRKKEHAIIVASTHFADEEVAKACLGILLDGEVEKQAEVIPYLLTSCTPLQSAKDRQLLLKLVEENEVYSQFDDDIKFLKGCWN